ncbi:unnamed protein product, partial [Symbiodinium microadriaticum]
IPGVRCGGLAPEALGCEALTLRPAFAGQQSAEKAPVGKFQKPALNLTAKGL